MPRILAEIDTLKFKRTEYTAAVKKHIDRQFRNAARAFLRAAIPRVPVDTGMAVGSFLNIGRMLNVAVPIRGVNTRKKRYYYSPARGQLKTPALGAKLSSMSLITESEDKLKFELKSGVFHYNLLDFIGVFHKSGANMGAWGSFEAGQRAFMEVMSDLGNRYRFPQLKDYIVKTRTTVTTSGGFKRTIVPIDSTHEEHY